ncbi:hypothetical protein OUZ56_017632 [Daphnia magna]|uniref:Uncharacterized protein n=1 Tax=Daphnia magna TaxID=35525 RepID=A0ABR0ATA9_9CRUS|nr:hypothetical protein OUZ56_017632 [Daphnia magna]
MSRILYVYRFRILYLPKHGLPGEGIGTFGLVAQRTPGFPTLGLLALDTWTTGSRQEDICLATLGLLVPDVWARQSMLLNPASPLRDYDK